MKYNRLVQKLREQIHEFSGRLSPQFSVPKRRFIEEMIYGIQAKQDVKLSSIGRSLEEKIPLAKTETRLSRNLDAPGMDRVLTDELIRMGSRRVHQDTLLILDISDISKQYARRMEYLAHVRDGSTGEIVPGYWTCAVVACETEGERIVPLYHTLYSTDAPDHVSENEEIMGAVDAVRRHTRDRGVWVMDRGGDRGKLFDAFIERGARFIIRLKGDRHLIYKGTPQVALDLALRCPTYYVETVVRMHRGEETIYTIEYGYRKVHLPGKDGDYYLVVVKGFGREPMMLLTTLPCRKKRKVLWHIVRSYITRWRIEEVIRFMKQSYHMEDIRVLTYRRLKNLIALVFAASYFAAVYVGEHLKLTILARKVLMVAKRFFGVPPFHYYARADGIAAILAHATVGPLGAHRKPVIASPQLRLFDG
jgi:hypothetical protein